MRQRKCERDTRERERESERRKGKQMDRHADWQKKIRVSGLGKGGGGGREGDREKGMLARMNTLGADKVKCRICLRARDVR